jgi:hypothetical protein
MPRPFLFSDIQQFRTALSAPDNRKRVRLFFEQRCDNMEVIVNISVAGNTFRAFPFRKFGLTLKPSAVYRQWTVGWLERSLIEFRSIRTRSQMRDLFATTASRLEKHWLTCTSGKHSLGFGRAAKLLNLTMKHAMWLTELTSDEREALIPLLDVPLDSYTLQGIRMLLPELGIPPNASMSFVRDRGQYDAIQDGIVALCGPELRSVDYEVAAWNLAHPAIDPEQQLEQTARRIAR